MSIEATPASHRHPWLRRLMGRLLTLAGWSVGTIAAIALFANVGSNYPRFVVGAGMLVAFPLLYVGHKLRLYSAEEAIADDPRPPVLYLRSFAADSDELGMRVVASLFARLGTDYQSFEQNLVRVFQGIGPVIAIGRPGETLPGLGAARMYVDDAQWQQRVSELSARAALVVLLVGKTEGFWWEVARVAKDMDPRRVLFVVPGDERTLRVLAYEEFRTRANQILPKPLPQAQRDVRYIWFDNQWQPQLLGTKRRNLRQLLRGLAAGDIATLQLGVVHLEPLFQHHGVSTPGTKIGCLGILHLVFWLFVAMLIVLGLLLFLIVVVMSVFS